MRIKVISDTHGAFPENINLLGRFDVIVHCGDFFPPNSSFWSRRMFTSEAKLQMDWLKAVLPAMKEKIGDRKFIFVLGNHDFADPFEIEDLLKSNGINASCVHDKIFSYENCNFYGFPYIPFINGMFAYELENYSMKEKIDCMVNSMNQTYVDVIVAHCPPYQCLDFEGTNKNYGNSLMNDALDYKISQEYLPTYYLCGHIHGAFGISKRNSVTVVNAAITQNIIEV